MAETFPIYLAGEWVDSPHPLEIRNPYQDDLIGTTYLATRDQLETAIVAAEAVFPQLKTMPTFERVAILTKLAAKMREHRDEIARTICLEAAKPIRDAEVETDRESSRSRSPLKKQNGSRAKSFLSICCRPQKDDSASSAVSRSARSPGYRRSIFR